MNNRESVKHKRRMLLINILLGMGDLRHPNGVIGKEREERA